MQQGHFLYLSIPITTCVTPAPSNVIHSLQVFQWLAKIYAIDNCQVDFMFSVPPPEELLLCWGFWFFLGVFFCVFFFILRFAWERKEKHCMKSMWAVKVKNDWQIWKIRGSVENLEELNLNALTRNLYFETCFLITLALEPVLWMYVGYVVVTVLRPSVYLRSLNSLWNLQPSKLQWDVIWMTPGMNKVGKTPHKK